MNRDFPCICSHAKRCHRDDNAIDTYCISCWDVLSSNSGHPKLIGVDYMYHKFIPDNLKYLEKTYEQSVH